MQGFELSRHGVPVEMPVTAQRLLAFLAVAGSSLSRTYIAGVLWSESSEARAGGSLRSALWRLQCQARGTVVAGGTRLSLAPIVRVDFRELLDHAHRLLAGAVDEVALVDSTPGAADDFAHELLPDWYDEWLVVERERLRQLQLHALEALSVRLRGRQSYGQAVEAAQLAVAAEPTRESARRVLIEAHLAEGNVDEAFRELRHFRELLKRELGVEPSPRLIELVTRSHLAASWQAQR